MNSRHTPAWSLSSPPPPQLKKPPGSSAGYHFGGLTYPLGKSLSLYPITYGVTFENLRDEQVYKELAVHHRHVQLFLLRLEMAELRLQHSAGVSLSYAQLALMAEADSSITVGEVAADE